jgi:arabinogalactan oligomer/maltooligosaccharide transport system substrate-binding protein
VIRGLIGQFEQRNPKIHINLVYKNYFQARTAFVNAVEEGKAPGQARAIVPFLMNGINAAEENKAPDVFRSDVSWVAQFASRGYLLNIDPYISQGLSDYLSTPLSYDHYRGHYYGLPQVTDFLALLYNKAELKSAGITSLPPRTMTDFAADAIKVVHARKARYGFETSGASYNTMPFLYAFGGGMLDQHGNIIVNNAGSVEGLNFLLNLQNRRDKIMPQNVDFSNRPVNPIVTDFMNGKTAMIFDGPYDISQILAGANFKSNPANLGIAPIPTCPAGSSTCRPGRTGSPSGGQSYVISAGTLHPIEAYNFISFMSSKPSQIRIAEANHTLPTRQSAYRDNRVSGEHFISEFRAIESTAVPQPNIPQAVHFFETFDPHIAAALDGVESPTTALNAVAAAWKQLLASS